MRKITNKYLCAIKSRFSDFIKRHEPQRKLPPKAYMIWYRLYPVKRNKIIFDSFHGKGYGDNPKYIAEEIIRQGLNYDMIWVVNDINAKLPYPIRPVLAGTKEEMYEYATAKVIIRNCKYAHPYYKKKSQYYIQTWHGGFALKYIEKEAEDKLPIKYVTESKQDSHITDVMLASCDLISSIMRNSFWFNGEVWECGIPREDIFFNSTPTDVLTIRRKYGIPDDYRILTYAPTFRDNGDTSAYNIDLDSLKKILEYNTGEKWISIVRLHPNVAYYSYLFNYSDTTINGSYYADPQELMLITDMLITDYNSVMMDCALMNKPVLLYLPDYNEYITNSRGLRPIYDELPFDKLYTNEQLQNAIESFDNEKYQHALSDFLATKYTNFSDGNASKRVVERIKKITRL